MFLFYRPISTLYLPFAPQVEIEGLTGDIKFNDDGRRVNYTLHVVEMTVNSAMVCVYIAQCMYVGVCLMVRTR